MSDQDTEVTEVRTAPTKEGWYRYASEHDSHWMLFSLYQGQWYAHVLNGSVTPCHWEYIDQAGAVEEIFPSAWQDAHPSTSGAKWITPLDHKEP